MTKFEVSVQETKTVVYEVEAEDAEEAEMIYEYGDIIFEKSNMFEIQDVEEAD